MRVDVNVLNFALTLEHLENAFYVEGLKKHSQNDFLKAGLPQWVRGRFEQIAKHGKIPYLALVLRHVNLFMHRRSDPCCLPGVCPRLPSRPALQV